MRRRLVKFSAALVTLLFLASTFKVFTPPVVPCLMVSSRSEPQNLLTKNSTYGLDLDWSSNFLSSPTVSTFCDSILVEVCSGRNGSTRVILASSEALTIATSPSSTLIIPPPELKNKIDPNLLNLTYLVSNGYMQNNKTEVLISEHSAFFSQDFATSVKQRNLVDETHALYTSKRASPHMVFLSAYLNYSAIFELARNNLIDYLWLNRKFTACLDQSVPIIKDPTEWANVESSFHRSIDGSGIKIAILDTGIDTDHPDFYSLNGTSKIVAATSFTGEPSADGHGHGTHCASTAAGTGAASAEKYEGVAPGAALMNVKVLDNTGWGQESWIISGIQWAVDNGADILSMSFGEFTDTNRTDPLSTTVNWATEQGVVCVVAAGNSGSSGMYSVTSPGVAELAITVGASSKTDGLASFSSLGPTVDYRVKPDVVAPGVNIVAARANGTSMGTPVSVYYTKASGTSMATPHVAGAAALLLDAHPSWSPQTIKKALANYAENIGSNVCGQGSGRVNICKSATPAVVGDPSVTFGRVHLNSVLKENIVFQNLGDGTLHLTVEAETWLMSDHTFYPATSLNTSSLSITSGMSGKVELQLDTSVQLPGGYFEGKVIATFDNVSIKIPLFFCVLSTLDCEVVDENGSKLEACFVLIDARSGESRSNLLDGRFIITSPGEYIVQAMNVYEWSPSGIDLTYSFLVHEKLSIGTDESKNVQISLSSVHKIEVRSTDLSDRQLYVQLKKLVTPYYTTVYFMGLEQLANQYIYLTNISDYIYPGELCFFGYMAFYQDDVHWEEPHVLTSRVDAYFIGWDLSEFAYSNFSAVLNYDNLELATLNVESLLPKNADSTTIWFEQTAGMWQTGLWYGFQTHPGIGWTFHILPCQFKENPSDNWALTEWSCLYVLGPHPTACSDYYVVDRHFSPLTKGETFTYSLGKTPLLPQTARDGAPYFGDELLIPYYPLHLKDSLFIGKTNPLDTKRLEVFRNGGLICNETKNWAMDPIFVKSFLESYGYGFYVFRVRADTTMDLCSRNLAEYKINYASSNSDLLPPTITKIECPPNFVDNTYPVEIELSDNQTLSDVSLEYSLDDGPWNSSPLTNLGNGRYSTEFNIDPLTQKISLKIAATDINGNAIVFITEPVANRGYRTQLTALLIADKISGNLDVIDGALLQPIYLRVKSNETEMYTLTDLEGKFEFVVPQSISFPIEIEMADTGPYQRTSILIDKTRIHDIAVTGASPSKDVIGQGFRLDINVIVVNEGDYDENFSLTVYANVTSIKLENIAITNGKSINVTFKWDTIAFARGSYTMKAVADTVLGETDTADNTYTDGVVRVVIAGDINGDGIVDIFDAITLALAYGSSVGEPRYDADFDINSDGTIDIFDAIILAASFGEGN